MLLGAGEKEHDDPHIRRFSMKIGNREFDVKNKTYIMGISECHTRLFFRRRQSGMIWTRP